MSLFSILFGKTYEDKNGYLRFSDSGKPVHRWSAEKKIGRKLRKGEVVHHKDRKEITHGPIFMCFEANVITTGHIGMMQCGMAEITAIRE